MLNFNKLKSYMLGAESSEMNVIKNMAKLASGDGISRIIGFVSMPIITRIYLPEHLGVLSIFVAIVAIIVPISTFRYSLAIPLPKSDGLAMNIVVVATIILLFSSILISSIFAIFGEVILTAFSMEQLIAYWYLVPIAILGSGIYEVLSNWALREKAFTSLANTKVWQKTIGSVTKIGFGLIGLKPLGLLIGHVFTQAGGIISLYNEFQGTFSNRLKYISKSRLKFSLLRYSEFPKYRMPSQILLIGSSKLILFYFGWQYGTDMAGLMGLALMMVMMPISLFGYSTGKAYYAEIAKIGKKKPAEILAVTKSIVIKLIFVGVIPFLILFSLGPWFFEVIFGNEWAQAGQFASILSIYLLAQFIYAPISEGVFNVFEKQLSIFLLEIGRLFVTIIAFAISFALNWPPVETVWIYSILITLTYLYASYLVFSVIINSIERSNG